MTEALLHQLRDPIALALQRLINGAHRVNGKPFDPATPFHPPKGRHTSVHYGLMFPGLPAPLNFLDIIAVIGQPPTRLFGNPHLVETTARDSANLLVGTGLPFEGQFRGYQVERDLRMAPDGSSIRFADDFVLEGTYPDFHVEYRGEHLQLDVQVRATDKVAHFTRLRGGIYDHWSLLCEHEGTVTRDGVSTQLTGLNTLEYARAAAVALPLRFFTYQILNIDAETQVLMCEVRGPAGLPGQQAVYVRSLTDHGAVYERGFAFEIEESEPTGRMTPNGLTMRLPTRWGWSVQDESGAQLIAIEATANEDYVFGMAGGYVGSFTYTGHFRDSAIDGTGYAEFIGEQSTAQGKG